MNSFDISIKMFRLSTLLRLSVTSLIVLNYTSADSTIHTFTQYCGT